MSAQHTPGPWHAKDVSIECDPCHGDARSNLVALVYSCGHGPLRANRALIAAAPELLAALTDARFAIASLPEFALGGVELIDTQSGECTGQYGIRDELLSKIDAAIAKATTLAQPPREASAEPPVSASSTASDAFEASGAGQGGG